MHGPALCAGWWRESLGAAGTRKHANVADKKADVGDEAVEPKHYGRASAASSMTAERVGDGATGGLEFICRRLHLSKASLEVGGDDRDGDVSAVGIVNRGAKDDVRIG
mmetsp:Transcript_54755/g.122488  ORF Transcript_54755/g.122488 Transcript_54755/m.122488 type:complete len:108 (-) Transcript_54755:385-708(-)